MFEPSELTYYLPVGVVEVRASDHGGGGGGASGRGPSPTHRVGPARTDIAQVARSCNR